MPFYAYVDPHNIGQVGTPRPGGCGPAVCFGWSSTYWSLYNLERLVVSCAFVRCFRWMIVWSLISWWTGLSALTTKPKPSIFADMFDGNALEVPNQAKYQDQQSTPTVSDKRTWPMCLFHTQLDYNIVLPRRNLKMYKDYQALNNNGVKSLSVQIHAFITDQSCILPGNMFGDWIQGRCTRLSTSDQSYTR